MAAALYDTIGGSYASTRRPDPRIAAHLRVALAGMNSVVNVGAGTGAYELPVVRIAVEPSAVMIAQRGPDAAPVVRAVAEALPLASGVVDAALAVLTVHHWSSVRTGLSELRRVARHRVVVLTWDVEVVARFWLLTDYLPEAAAMDRSMAVPMDALLDALPGATVTPVLIPHDCSDGFGVAFWQRPAAYLDPSLRAGMSMIARLAPGVAAAGLARLERDVDSGRWHDEHADLLQLTEWDAGFRQVVADLDPAG